jgi:hypothetical protein
VRRRAIRVEVDSTLDLVPVLSLVVHLVPMLLLSLRFGELAQHAADRSAMLPAPAPTAEALVEQSRDRLVVVVEPAALVAPSGQRFSCPGPCRREDPAFADLRRAMEAEAARRPSASEVVLAPSGDVPYDTLVGVLDAVTRRADGAPLFPEPRFVAAPVPG